MAGKLKVFKSHDCELPEIKFTIKTETHYNLNFWGRKIPYEVETKVYEHDRASFICECGAQWIWLGYRNEPVWFCQERPQEWVTVDS